MGIILRIIGGFKKEFSERIIGEFKSIIYNKPIVVTDVDPDYLLTHEV